jgi:dTDP-glucose 4,6-dehydratase
MPRAVVTGGSGFVGSHLCRALLARGWEVVAVDNLLTGRRDNIDDLVASEPRFTLVEYDVVAGVPVEGRVDAVLHFASPASPTDYHAHPIETLEVGSLGTRHALDLALANDARFLLASTSEIYGDPLVHPQSESYPGNVSSVGPRSMYDEAKRYAEAITMAYHRLHDLDTGIARIFNVYGPYLWPSDGRAVSNFLTQALGGRPITIYGTGNQTRSFCFIDDEVEGILALLESDHVGPMNIGSPDELTILELAETVLEVTGSSVELVFEPLPGDDPQRRRPDISLAQRVLGWKPTVDLRDGLTRTANWYRSVADLA